MDNIITKSQINDAVEETYNLFMGVKDGKNADYIPYLANIPSDLFGISIVLEDGTVISCGATDYKFGIESISKVPTALLVMRQSGSKELLEKIGADATGLPFNSICAIILENDHPSTPLVNAGAISACSMVKPVGKSDQKWAEIMQNINELTASDITLIDELYKSESETNYNNRAIAWLLKNFSRIYDDPDMALDLYTRQCSLAVTTKDLAVMGSTIAFAGFNPVSKKQIFDPEYAIKTTSLIATVGFYQNTGDWMYSCGIPAKTGVGGGVMGIVPGVMGIAAFSPPLDEAGNSVRAQLAIKHIANKLNINIYNQAKIKIEL